MLQLKEKNKQMKKLCEVLKNKIMSLEHVTANRQGHQ